MAASRVDSLGIPATRSIRPPAADHPANIDLGLTQPIDITASLAAAEHRTALYGEEM